MQPLQTQRLNLYTEDLNESGGLSTVAEEGADKLTYPTRIEIRTPSHVLPSSLKSGLINIRVEVRLDSGYTYQTCREIVVSSSRTRQMQR